MDKILCIGKNNLEHAKELGDAVPESPVVFLKSPAMLQRCNDGAQVKLPWHLGPIHFEAEYVLQWGQGVAIADPAGLASSIEKVYVGLDLTRRDLQETLKKNGHPWTRAKCFSNAAILGPCIATSLDQVPDFEFFINGVCRQKGSISLYRFGPLDILSHLRAEFPLIQGDLIYLGTFSGVGALAPGDRCEIRWGSKVHRFSLV